MATSSETVVIGVDESSYAVDAFKWYFEHMHKPQNKVIMVHGMEMPSVPSRDTWDQQTKLGRTKGEEVKDRFIELLKQYNTDAKFVMDFEKPTEFIVATAKDENADLIIMGTRGMGTLRRTILGSVSNYVLNHAYCPVLVVRS